MKIGIYSNLNKDADLSVTKAIMQILRDHKRDFYLFDDLKGLVSHDKFFNFEALSDLSLVITVGGDGTVLTVAQECIKYDIPLLAVNKGTKGFLTEIEPDNLNKIEEILDGNYAVDDRMLVDAGYDGQAHTALNEIFITRAGRKMITVSAYIGGLIVDRYSCDGLLISTPTGSTAYSLSAGGPVISPNAPVLCITPVNSHRLHTRPVLVDDNEVITVKIETDCDDAVIIADGFEKAFAKKGDSISMRKSNKSLRFLRQKDSSFYLKVLTKLSFT